MVLEGLGTAVLALLLSATPPVSATPPASNEVTEAAASDDTEELVCKRKLQKSDKMGERYKSTKICKTRDEWEKDRRR
jgi:hypothetical protein